MKLDKKQLLLYAVTDRTWLGDNSIVKQVEECVQGGATFIQLREKDLDEQAFLAIAKAMKNVTDTYNVPFVINDNITVALNSNADGVHVGQGDTETAIARRQIGPNKILGVSVQTVEQAKKAEQDGADYLGVGAVFSTATKTDASDVSFDTLKEICESVNIPVIAIGGINEENMRLLKDSGICGVAVVSAIFAQKDIKQATQRLNKVAGELF